MTKKHETELRDLAAHAGRVAELINQGPVDQFPGTPTTNLRSHGPDLELVAIERAIATLLQAIATRVRL